MFPTVKWIIQIIDELSLARLTSYPPFVREDKYISSMQNYKPSGVPCYFWQNTWESFDFTQECKFFKRLWGSLRPFGPGYCRPRMFTAQLPRQVRKQEALRNPPGHLRAEPAGYIAALQTEWKQFFFTFFCLTLLLAASHCYRGLCWFLLSCGCGLCLPSVSLTTLLHFTKCLSMSFAFRPSSRKCPVQEGSLDTSQDTVLLHAQSTDGFP